MYRQLGVVRQDACLVLVHVRALYPGHVYYQAFGRRLSCNLGLDLDGLDIKGLIYQV